MIRGQFRPERVDEQAIHPIDLAPLSFSPGPSFVQDGPTLAIAIDGMSGLQNATLGHSAICRAHPLRLPHISKHALSDGNLITVPSSMG